MLSHDLPTSFEEEVRLHWSWFCVSYQVDEGVYLCFVRE